MVGNDGSHGISITTREIIDTYRIIESLIDEIYEKRTEKTNLLIQSITKNRLGFKWILNSVTSQSLYAVTVTVVM